MKKNYTYGIIVVLCIFQISLLVGQNTSWTIINKKTSSLPSDTVNAIAFDKLGVVWIGTDNGLAKLDGNTWTIYKKTNSGIPNNKISSITIDSLGNKWIGTRGSGLAMFNGTTWSVFTSTNSLVMGKNVGGVAVDSLGNKWVVSNMLAKLGPTNQSISGWSIPYCQGTSQDTVMNCIAVDRRDIKWMGASVEGVYYCSNIFSKMNVGPMNTVVLKGADVWFGGDYGFMISGASVNCGTFSFGLYNTSVMQLKDAKVSAIAFDNCNNAWIGTKTGGLGRYPIASTGTLALTTANSPLPSNVVKCISSRGTEKWIGTTKGIALLNTGCAYQYTYNAIGMNEKVYDASEITAFPNPAHDKINILLPNYAAAKVQMFDLLGKEVKQLQIENGSATIELSELQKGMYLMRVEQGINVSVKSFVVQ